MSRNGRFVDAVKVDPSLIAPSSSRPDANETVAGSPLRTTWICHPATDEGFECGVWECEVGSYRLEFDAGTSEFFCVQSGLVRMVSDSGHVVECGAGEACVIPAGFRGIVEVVEPVRKHYVYRKGPA